MVPPAVARLSRVWFPSGGIAASSIEDAHSKLVRAGFLRQSHSGMFHMLPLGRRVQDKVENLVAGHMEELLCELATYPSSICSRILTAPPPVAQLLPESHCHQSRQRLYGKKVAACTQPRPRFVIVSQRAYFLSAWMLTAA